MLISKKNLVFIVLLVASSTKLCASDNSWISTIKNFFSSLASGKFFKKPPLSKRWIGVGALAITSTILAWKYFKKSEDDGTGLSDEEFGNYFDFGTPPPSDEENDQEEQIPISDDDQASDAFLASSDMDANQNNSDFQKEPFDDSYLDKLLDETDDAYEKKQLEIDDQLEVGDVVKIINDSSSIEMAPDDIQMYNKITNRNKDHNVQGIYLNSIAIIREKNQNKIKIEMETIGEGGKSANFSAYFTILSSDVKKMLTQPVNNELKMGTCVKVKLSPTIVMNKFDSYINLSNNNPYDKKFDSNNYYIGFVKEINLRKERAIINCCFHWREFCPPPTDFEVPINSIFSIYDPDTRQPILVK